MAATSQADLLEAIPFIREITPFDLLDLPAGLFESLPKPCNLKRSATAGGPIWPPVLTNVLVNGLLILHHKPHLVGKQGLEEHYNWLSAFIYRQTRGWDQSALARNTIEAKRIKPDERLVGIIRNRKQISSKVQTIGEYLKDTHWAYVTQGPRSLKDATSTGPAAGFPASSPETAAKVSPNNPVDQSPRNATAPDVSHVSLQLAWSPPTPFSLPASPSHLPFLYPDDIPDYEFVDARLLGYDPRDWPEFEGQMAHSRRMRHPLILDQHSFGKHERQTEFEVSLSLTSASMTVHFEVHPSHIEGVSPHLILGAHQLANLSQESFEPIQTLSAGDLDSNTQRLVQTIQTGSRVYHVDLPIHLPTASADRMYLVHDAGPEFNVKCNVGFHAGGPTPLHDEELTAVVEIYLFSAQDKDHSLPERLDEYQEVLAIRTPKGCQPGVLTTHGFAALFAGKIWANALETSNAADAGKSHTHRTYHAHRLFAHDADLSRHRIVQHILPRSHRAGTKPLLTIIYSPRLVTSARESTARLLVLDEDANAGPTRSNSVCEPGTAGNTPKETPRLHFQQADAAPKRSSRSDSSTALERHSRHLSKSAQRQPTPSSDTAGPVRNTRSHSRSRGLALLRRPVTGSSPLTAGIKLPLTPQASPLITVQKSRRNSATSPFLHPAIAYNSVVEDQHGTEFSNYASTIPQSIGGGIFDSPHLDNWSPIIGTAGSFQSNVDLGSAYAHLPSSLWPYPREVLGEIRPRTPTPLDFHDSQQHDLTRALYPHGGHHDDLSYGGASWP